MEVKIKNLLIKLCLLILLITSLYSSPVDTGMKQWEQPNGITFNAHLKGDEFFIQFTTDTGYEIREGTNKLYYYAVIDINDNIKSGSGVYFYKLKTNEFLKVKKMILLR